MDATLDGILPNRCPNGLTAHANFSRESNVYGYQFHESFSSFFSSSEGKFAYEGWIRTQAAQSRASPDNDAFPVSSDGLNWLPAKITSSTWEESQRLPPSRCR